MEGWDSGISIPEILAQLYQKAHSNFSKLCHLVSVKTNTFMNLYRYLWNFIIISFLCVLLITFEQLQTFFSVLLIKMRFFYHISLDGIISVLFLLWKAKFLSNWENTRVFSLLPLIRMENFLPTTTHSFFIVLKIFFSYPEKYVK